MQEHLEKKLTIAQDAKNVKKHVSELSQNIATILERTIFCIDEIMKIMENLDLDENLSIFREWRGNLEELLIALKSPLENYPLPHFNLDQVKTIFTHQKIIKSISNIESALKKMKPKISPQQNAWDTLTRLEENIQEYEMNLERLNEAEKLFKRSKILLDCYIEAQNSILENLYENICDEFIKLYQELHGSDKDQFSANFKVKKAGIDFEVDFYGRGIHPPQALHSEGHQDSMGICLYLALAEYLTKDFIDLIILDDVVMSVDIDHRREICHLLTTSFPDRQFFITTHDRTWVNQLRSAGVVSSKNIVKFSNWNIETGPQTTYEKDFWNRIEEDLQRGDIHNAALKLRRGSEEFFSMVCDSMKAQATFKLKQYQSLLKRAKKVAQSWGDKENFEKLCELDSIRKQIFSRLNVEQWAINKNIHYNNWSNFSEQDFRPVIEAFHDLFDLFICNQCGEIIHLVTRNEFHEESVRCNCGKIYWNLVKKDKTDNKR